MLLLLTFWAGGAPLPRPPQHLLAAGAEQVRCHATPLRALPTGCILALWGDGWLRCTCLLLLQWDPNDHDSDPSSQFPYGA